MNRIFLAFLSLFMLASEALGGDYQIEEVKITHFYDSNITRVTLTGPGPLEYSNFEMVDPSRLVFNIPNAAMPDAPLALQYWPPVRRISFQHLIDPQRGISMIIEYEPGASYKIIGVSNGIEISFINPPKPDSLPQKSVTQPRWLKEKINLVLENGEISTALNLLSRKAGFNLVVSDLSEKALWVNLSNVTVEEALEAILMATGNAYYTFGDVVVVMRQELEESRREFETRVYELKYADASKLAESLQGLLSPNARIKILNPISSEPVRYVLVSDRPENHQLVEDIISNVDVPPKQIAISVKFIETNISGEDKLGIDWNKMVETKLTGAIPPTGGTEAPAFGNLSAYSSWPPDKNSFTLGTLTISEATAVLNYLQREGKSRLLSDPTVTTSDGKEARISVSTSIPIQTINRFSEGAVIQDIVTYEYREVGISLNVTPRVNKEGRITLVCKPTVEEITGWVGPENNQQPITTKRSVETEVVVADGATLVIGGLYKEAKIENVSKVWLLGSIPILGHLFRHKTTTDSKTDLMIFITPQIID